MTLPYPLPRETRSTGPQAFDGVSVTFGPFQFQIFDTLDVRVQIRHAGDAEWSETDAVTIAKVDPDAAYGTFTATFDDVHPATSQYQVVGRRLHQRSLALSRGSGLNLQELEKETTKQGSILQELRRDVTAALFGFLRTLRAPFGEVLAPIPSAADRAQKVLGFDSDGQPVALISAEDVAGAQIYAQAALEARNAAQVAQVLAEEAGDEATAAAAAAVLAEIGAVDAKEATEAARDDVVTGLAAKADLVAGKVPTSQLPDSVLGTVQFQTTWNASTNTPTIPAAAAENRGHYYKVTVAGSTLIDGEDDWQIGDWIISDGTAWSKVDNSEVVVDGNYHAALVFGQTAKATPVNADTFFLTDSAASNGPKKITWQNLKAGVLSSPTMTGNGSINGSWTVGSHVDIGAATGGAAAVRIGGPVGAAWLAPTNLAGSFDYAKQLIFEADGDAVWTAKGGFKTTGILTVTGASGTIAGNEIWHDGNASEKVDDRVGALLQAGTNITVDYNDATNTLIISASGTVSAAAADVSFSPTGGIAATNVQAALAELDTEKAPKNVPSFTGNGAIAGAWQAVYYNAAGNFPGFDYVDTDTGNPGWGRWRGVYDNGTFTQSIRNVVNDAQVAVASRAYVDATGVFEWQWLVSNAVHTRLTSKGLLAPAVHIGGSGRPIQKMEYHGGVSGNVATDTAAFAAAISALPASGGAIELGAGTTLLSSLQTINAAATANILIEGKPGISKIETRGTGGAVKVVFAGAAASPANTNRRLTVQGIKFVTNQTDAGWAIDAEWPTNAGEPGRLFTLRDVDIEGVDQALAHYFTGGLRLKNGKQSYISGFNIKGQSVNTLADYGIYLDNCVQTMIDQAVVYHLGTGLYVTGDSEGVYWTGGSTAVTCGKGIHWETTGATPYQGTALEVNGGHFSCEDFAVLCVNVSNVHVLHSVIQKRELSSNDHAGVVILSNGASAIKGSIHDCLFSRGASSPGANNGIIIGDSGGGGGRGLYQIHHNQGEFLDTFVWLQSGVSGCVVESNKAMTSVTTLVNDQGTGNTVRNNIP